MKYIDKIIKESIHHFLINEIATDREFHFTDIDNLMGIIRSNKINLNADEQSERNGYNYLSLTRQRSGEFGFPHNTLTCYDNTFGYARIEFDGRKLNYNFKVKPFNYGGKERLERGQTSNKQFAISTNDPHHDNVETEDGLHSHLNYIKNPLRYIVRIDVFAKPTSITDRESLEMLVDLLEEKPEWKEKIIFHNTHKDMDKPYTNKKG